MSSVRSRVNQAEEEATPIVDVDGLYMYKKYQQITESGNSDVQLAQPDPPPSGWKVVDETTYKEVASTIPVVTSGQFSL